MKRVTMEINGFSTCWDGAEGTNIETLTEKLCLAGAAELIPNPQEDYAAFKTVLSHSFPKMRIFNLNLGGDSVAFSIVDEKTVDGNWNGSQEIRAYLVGGSVFLDPADEPLADMLTQRFAWEKKIVPASKMGQVLTRAVRELKGVSERSRGGTYWLQADKQERWEEIAQAVEAANTGFAIYIKETAHSPNTIRSVCSSLMKEVQTELDVIAEDLADGGAGAVLLRNRQATALELLSKVEEYEEILDDKREELDNNIAGIQAMLAAALLAVEAEKEAKRNAS